jgi:hypothetical protein
MYIHMAEGSIIKLHIELLCDLCFPWGFRKHKEDCSLLPGVYNLVNKARSRYAYNSTLKYESL